MFSVLTRNARIILISAALLGASCSSETTEGPSATPAGRHAQAAIRVLVAQARADNLEARPQASGLSRAFQRARVAAEVGGRVVRRAAEPGDQVAAGDPLVELDSTRAQLARRQAEAALVSRQTDLTEATRDASRGEKLASEKAISDSELERLVARKNRAASALQLAEVELSLATQNLEDTTIRAPFDGIVESVDVDPGEFIPTGTTVAMVVNLDRIRIRAGLTANEASRLRTGDPVQIVFDAGSGRPIDATIQSIGQVANARTGTFAVEIWVPNPDLSIRDGMTATIEFSPTARSSLPLIPRSALARSGNGAVVFVVEGTEEIRTASQRPVRLGESDRENIEVVRGVKAGELVVVDGHFALRDGSAVLVDQTNGD